MKAYKCRCCGAPLNPVSVRSFGFDLRCEYCGTCYEDNGGILEVVQVPVGCKTLVAARKVERDVAENKYAMELIHESLARDLAKAMMDCAEYETTDDPFDNTYRVTARVRVLKPEFRF